MRWDSILNAVLVEHGIWAVLFVAAIVGFYWWGGRMIQGRLDDRQREIDRWVKEVDRLRQENREYREMFLETIRDTIRTKGEDE